MKKGTGLHLPAMAHDFEDPVGLVAVGLDVSHFIPHKVHMEERWACS